MFVVRLALKYIGVFYFFYFIQTLQLYSNLFPIRGQLIWEIGASFLTALFIVESVESLINAAVSESNDADKSI